MALLSANTILTVLCLSLFSPPIPALPSRTTHTTSSPNTPTSRRAEGSPNCFPYGTATLPTDFSAPNVSLADWWCPHSLQYGFQGFSYPLEDDDCAAADNSFAQISADFAQMKADFGATVVRAYYPTCTEASIFENLLRAGVANNMAVIPQVWFDFGDDVSILWWRGGDGV